MLKVDYTGPRPAIFRCSEGSWCTTNPGTGFIIYIRVVKVDYRGATVPKPAIFRCSEGSWCTNNPGTGCTIRTKQPIGIRRLTHSSTEQSNF